MRRALADAVSGSAVCVLFLAAATAQAQGHRSLVGVVYARVDGTVLPNAVVRISQSATPVFTDSAGRFVIASAGASSRLEIRRIGFVPYDTVIHASDAVPDTIRIGLARVAVPLIAMRVVAIPPCVHPGPPADTSDTVLVSLFSQLHINAVQYRSLAESYPFTYVLGIERGVVKTDGTRVTQDEESIRVDALPKWKYRRGKVISTLRARGARSQLVNIPTLVEFASTEFVNNHCFHYAGVASLPLGQAHRIDFVPAASIREPDFAGQILLDVSTYQIRQLTFELSPPLMRGGTVNVTVTTDFAEVFPSVPVISSVRSEQVSAIPFGATSKTFETQRLVSFQFQERRP